MDTTPLAVHPHLPLETVMEMFKKLGPRVILVELLGKVCGLITVKDVLKYQFKVENEEHPRAERDYSAEEKLWKVIEICGERMKSLWQRCFQRRTRPALPDRSVTSEDELELVDRTH